jgi:hypothetical protein
MDVYGDIVEKKNGDSVERAKIHCINDQKIQTCRCLQRYTQDMMVRV